MDEGIGIRAVITLVLLTSCSGGQSGTSGAGGGEAPDAFGGGGGTGGVGPGTGGSGGFGASMQDASDQRGPAQLAAFDFGACALTAAGGLSCWGSLPPSTETVASPPGVFASVVGGFEHVCTLTSAGTLGCYGLPGTDVPPSPPPGSWVQADLGHNYVCAVAASGTAQCSVITAAPVAPTDIQFSELAAGDNFACGIHADDRSVSCFGDPGGSYSQCVRAPAEGQLDAPEGEFLHVAAGHAHVCGIRVDGTVACWGAGKPGSPPTVDACGYRYNYGQSAPPSGRFISISAGGFTTCGLLTDGTLACWGAGTMSGDCQNDLDACGQALPPEGQFEEIAVGFTHACAMRADRTVTCWGSDTGGRSTPPAEFQ